MVAPAVYTPALVMVPPVAVHVPVTGTVVLSDITPLTAKVNAAPGCSVTDVGRNADRRQRRR